MSKKTYTKKMLFLSCSLFSSIALISCSPKGNEKLETNIVAEASSTVKTDVYENATFTILDSTKVQPSGASPYLSFKAILKNDTDSEWVTPDMIQVVGNENTSTCYPIQLGEIIYSNESFAFVRGIANSEDLDNIKFAWKDGKEVKPSDGSAKDKQALIQYGIYPMPGGYYGIGNAIISSAITDPALWDTQGTNRSFIVAISPASAMDIVSYGNDVVLLDEDKKDVTSAFGADRIDYQGEISFVAVYESENALANLPDMETFSMLLSSVKYIEWHLEDGTVITVPITF